MISLMRLFRSIWNLVIDLTRDFIEWLRKDGSFLKLLTLFMMFGFLTAGFTAYEKEKTIQNLYVIMDQDSEQCRIDIENRDKRLSTIASILQQEKNTLTLMQESNRLLLEQFFVDIEVQSAEYLDWIDRYESRDQVCKSAIEFLDVACPSLGNF